MSIILVSHDLDMVARYADHVVFINNKTVECFGTPEEVFNNDKVVETFGMLLLNRNRDNDLHNKENEL